MLQTTFTKNGITYDGSEHTVVVTVGLNNAKNGMEVKSVTGADFDEEGNVYWKEVTNTYEAEGDAILKAKKDSDATLAGKTFKFELYDLGSETPDVPIDTIDDVNAGETKEFKTLHYILSRDLVLENGVYQKSFEYAIKEWHPADATYLGVTEYGTETYYKDGIYYDGRVHNVTIQVTDKQDGTLNITYNGLPGFVTPVFKNHYQGSGEAEINVKKILTGRDWLTNDQFEFTLSRVSAGAPLPTTGGTTLVIKSTDAPDYTKAYGKIAFSSTGTYRYKVVETINGQPVSGTINGITYDSSEHYVTITVSEPTDGSGTFVTNVVYEDDEDGAVAATFENFYGGSGSVEFTADHGYGDGCGIKDGYLHLSFKQGSQRTAYVRHGLDGRDHRADGEWEQEAGDPALEDMEEHLILVRSAQGAGGMLRDRDLVRRVFITERGQKLYHF